MEYISFRIITDITRLQNDVPAFSRCLNVILLVCSVHDTLALIRFVPLYQKLVLE